MAKLTAPVIAGHPSCSHSPDSSCVSPTSVCGGAELCNALNLPSQLCSPEAEALLPVKVPPVFLQQIEPGNPHDPLLLQVLPTAEETQATQSSFSVDPTEDLRALRAPNLLQKYVGRALLLTTGECAIRCRFCFRRHYPFAAHSQNSAGWGQALAMIASDTSLREVILSGGDPLMVPYPELCQLVEQIAQVPHIQRLRVHTRMPIVAPEQTRLEFFEMIAAIRLAPVVVVHVNHPHELSPAAESLLLHIAKQGILVLSQSVLLQGVNNDVQVLQNLFERLVQLRVLPYYLHQLDHVLGAKHFLVPRQQGQQLIRQLKATLPGYAVPSYVQDQGLNTGKSEIF